MKHLLTLRDVTKKQLLDMINLSLKIKKHPKKYQNKLKNKNLLMIFEKPSLRTRISFEVAMTQMGGHAIYYSIQNSPLGKGKESDVYRGLTPSEKQVVVKFHRLGQTSFRKVKQLRSFLKKRRHISWLYASRLSAKREFEALTKINDLNLNVNVPKPLGQNRHVIVMSILQGEEINRFEFLNDPDTIFNEIVKQYILI